MTSQNKNHTRTEFKFHHRVVSFFNPKIWQRCYFIALLLIGGFIATHNLLSPMKSFAASCEVTLANSFSFHASVKLN